MTHSPLPLALEIRGLAKRFERPAVDAIDLDVPAGEFYTLLGPNGAGKTTTLRMVSGLLKPDRGTIKIYSVDALADPVAAKRMTAWLSDEPMIYDKLTPIEYLAFVAGLWGVAGDIAEARAADLIEWLGLAPHAQERCESLSKGTRQKVHWPARSSGKRLETMQRIVVLNPDLIRAPIGCIDYVITHELAHLIHPNHSADFYELLDTVMADWEARKQRLESIML